MNKNIKQIFKEALKRAKEDKWWDWNRCSPEERRDLFSTYIEIRIIELELSEFISDLDLVAIKEIRNMPVDEWIKIDWESMNIPEPTDEFLRDKLIMRVLPGISKYV